MPTCNCCVCQVMYVQQLEKLKDLEARFLLLAAATYQAASINYAKMLRELLPLPSCPMGKVYYLDLKIKKFKKD